MSDFIHRFFTDFSAVITESTGDVVIYFTLVLLFVVIILIFYYVYNRRKYYAISHQIPARLVREHLNTIIRNSNALKSSLFNEKDLTDVGDIAEVAGQIEKQVPDDKVVKVLKREKEELENELKVLRDSFEVEDGPDMSEIIQERDDLLKAISDYKLLEDDLANIKKLKQENKELKNKLGVSDDNEPPPAAPSAPVEEEMAAAEDVVVEGEEEIESKAETVEGMAEEEVKEGEENTEEEKTAEDLLKEFEKMLGQ